MNQSLTVLTILVAGVLSSIGARSGVPQQSYIPPNGFVPDSVTAIAVAEAVLRPVYGSAQVNSERPFTAKLVGDHWVVEGHALPANMLGGVAMVEILKADARILRMTHGK